VKLFLSETEIQKRVQELGESLAKDFENCEILLLGVLKGSFLFFADLVRTIGGNPEIHFIQASSYGSSTKSSGDVKLSIDERILFHKKHVIVVEDIIDTGLTLQRIIKEIESKEPASLSICSLLLKKGKYTPNFKSLYYGFEIEDHFVVGYGLDHNEKYRTLRDIMILEYNQS